VTTVGRDDSGQITAARKDFGHYKVLYVTTPGLSNALYRTASSWAGVHQYTNRIGDMVEARGQALMVRPGSAGSRRIKLPFNVRRLYAEIEGDAKRKTRLLCENCDGTSLDAAHANTTVSLPLGISEQANALGGSTRRAGYGLLPATANCHHQRPRDRYRRSESSGGC
jgi:hypothetical protein